MRVRMLVAMPDGATADGQPWPKRGKEGDFPSHQAAHFVASGIAEYVTDETPEEVTEDGEVRTDERPVLRRKR